MKSILELYAMKQRGEKIVMVTAYDYSTAKIVDEMGVDMVLVGDSLAMPILGLKDTLSVGMKELIHHTKAVSRGLQNAFLVADLPFLSYQKSVKQALKNAGKLIKKGRANAVKLEGAYPKQIKALSKAGIPVICHLGLTPQMMNALGGFKVQGKNLKAAQQILDEARKAEENGACMVLLECVPELLAEKITQSLEIPTIGIGAGKACDAQVLVINDLLGLNSDFKPKFVKIFEDTRSSMQKGVKAYIDEVKGGLYPSKEHCFSCESELIEKLV